MLRLQPSEIAITPEDIGVVNERLDARKKAKARVQLHPGPERSRDDAVTTRLQQLKVSSHRAEVSSEDGSEPQPASSQARARIGLGAAPLQVQPRAGPVLTREPQPGSGSSTLRLHTSFAASTDRLILPLRLEPSDSSSTSTTSIFMPLQAQFDGPVDGLPSRETGSAYGTLRSASNSSLLLQSRTLSAPMIPQVTVQAPTPRTHIRQPFSDGAITFDGDSRSEQSYRLLRATRVDPRSGASNRFGAGSVHSVTQRVMRMSFNSPPRMGATSPSSPPDPRNIPARETPPDTSDSLPQIVRWIPDNRTLQAPPTSPTFSEAIRAGVRREQGRSSSGSSDSSAAEAATTGRLSPLESISQQAAIVHGRLASRQRQRRSSDQGLRPALISCSAAGSFQRHVPPTFQRPGLPGEPFDIELRVGRMIRWRDRQRAGYTSWHPDLLTSEELLALGLDPSPSRSLSPQSHRTLMTRSHDEMTRLVAREASRPAEALDRIQDERAEYSRAADLRAAPARFPIPERHSSRDIYTKCLPFTSMLNRAQVFTRHWCQGHHQWLCHAFDPLARLRHLTGEVTFKQTYHHHLLQKLRSTLPTASPRRNGAEIQRTTALPVAIRQRPEALTATPPRQSQHLHVPRAVARARQRNQENSEEATMEQFREDVAVLRERERRVQDESNESGVLDDTPPRTLGVERHLNGL